MNVSAMIKVPLSSVTHNRMCYSLSLVPIGPIMLGQKAFLVCSSLKKFTDLPNRQEESHVLQWCQKWDTTDFTELETLFSNEPY